MNGEEQYNIFLSWSGDYSREVATLLRDWLPNVVPSARPWISSEDITKGSVWPTELNRSLATCNIGVVVLTPDNLNSAWLLFEAGVLFNARVERPVFTLCCDVEPPIVGPLGQFQTTRCVESDLLHLAQDVNKAIGMPHDRSRVERWFDKFWPEFSQRLTGIRETHSGAQGPARATDRALLEEILSGVRPLRQLQAEIEETALRRVASIEWYTPFWVAQERECYWLFISKTSIARFLKAQMRDPPGVDRIIQLFWTRSEAISGYQETRGKDALEGLIITWHSRYDRGYDGHYMYVDAIADE